MPGIHGALSVRISDGDTDRHVTRYVRNLAFSKVAPGGHQELTFTMLLPRGTFRDLGPQDRVWVYDTRTGRCLFDGYLENPVPVDGPRGQSYAIRAVGGMALANDESRPLVYVTTDLGDWTQQQTSAASSSAGTGSTVPGLLMQFNPGQPITVGSIVSMVNDLWSKTRQSLGGVHLFTYSGRTDVNYRAELYYNTGYAAVGDSAAINTGGLANDLYVGTHFPAGPADLSLQVRRVAGGATNISTDDVWSFFSQIAMVGQRRDRYGNELTGAAGIGSTTSVLAHQVVEDLLGRLMVFCDPNTAVVDPTSFAINQLAWTDGIKAAGVLNELTNWEPDHLWEVLETVSNGRHRFAYRAWPTEPRYEVSTDDGWTQEGSDVDLCNRILVNWTDATGTVQTTEVTAAGLGLLGQGLPVDDLGDRVKDAEPVSLSEGTGSEENALRIGEALLRDSISPPLAGRVVVARHITDRLNGNRVAPWELEPGYVARVRETGDELRITEAAYDDDATAATLTLGTPVLTREQRLARLDAA